MADDDDDEPLPTKEHGRVIFSGRIDTTGPAGDVVGIIRTEITQFWTNYLKMDLSAFVAHFHPQARRVTPLANCMYDGIDAIAKALPQEWQYFERPHQKIAEKRTIRDVELSIDNSRGKRHVRLFYYIDIEGGVTWPYSDTGAVWQILEEAPGSHPAWKILHHVETWSLDDDDDEKDAQRERERRRRKPAELRSFDWATPVQDLQRAVAFYAPILGEPEPQGTPQRASFNLNGFRLHLVHAPALPSGIVLSPGRAGLPNGFAMFHVSNLVETLAQLQKSGCAPCHQPERGFGNDLLAVLHDPFGNPIVLWQRDFNAGGGHPESSVSGFPDGDPMITAAATITTAWLHKDATALARYYDQNSYWFDNTKLKGKGIMCGWSKIRQELERDYWPNYDASPGVGILAKIAVSHVRVVPAGETVIVSYQAKVEGTAVHSFRDWVSVTQVIRVNNLKILWTCNVALKGPEAFVAGSDYIGYPVTDLNKAKRFYGSVLRLGQGYPADSYYGYWLDHDTVFGLYQANPRRDKIPRDTPGHPNGYCGLWVQSAERVYRYLSSHGSTFPHIPAINDKAGLEVSSGEDEGQYSQCVGTDPDGNVIVFTEYTGRSH